MSDQPRSRAGWKRLPFRPITPGAAHAIVALFLLSFLLSATSYWLSVRAVRGEVASRATVTQLCLTGNESRMQQITLWTHLVAISTPPPHETPAQQARRAEVTREFLAFVRRVFAPRDCVNFKG